MSASGLQRELTYKISMHSLVYLLNYSLFIFLLILGVLGSGAVGKTSFCIRYVKNIDFCDYDYDPTLEDVIILYSLFLLPH
jgi:GTPase SAR1 family protein